MYTKEEIRAVRFYTGDVEGSEPFWSDPKAYVVLNSLFFDGIGTETARAGEGKYLDPDIIADIPRLAGFFNALFSVFGKNRSETERHTFRVERFSDYSVMKQKGHTVSFTSTSEAGFLSEYRDRTGIALMKFVIPQGTPCIQMGEVLSEYVKSSEAEVLLPPFMELDITETAVSTENMGITDRNGAPPVTECRVLCGKYRRITVNENSDKYGAEAGIRVFNALNEGKAPSAEDTALYTAWKRELFNVSERTDND